MGKCVNCNKRSYDKTNSTQATEKLCGSCISTLKRTYCTYCRRQFRLLSKDKSLPTSAHKCLKCKDEEELHGKPSNCSVCAMSSAFESDTCRRCTKNKGKYGTPVACLDCGRTSAFNTGNNDGEVLCYSCKLNQKRADKDDSKSSKKRKTTDSDTSSSQKAQKKSKADISSKSSGSLSEVLATQTKLQNSFLEYKASADAQVAEYMQMVIGVRQEMHRNNVKFETERKELEKARISLATMGQKMRDERTKVLGEMAAQKEIYEQQLYDVSREVKQLKEELAEARGGESSGKME